MIKKLPHTYAIVSTVIIICAILSWLIPAGEFDREVVTVDGVKKTLLVEGSYHLVERAPQSWQIFTAFLKGFEQQAGIIAFLLVIGGAFFVVEKGNAIIAGISSFLNWVSKFEQYKILKKLKVHNIILASIIVLFSLFGAVFGLSEETLVFVGVLIPLTISMGFDSIVGVCVVYVAAHVGFSGAVLNPFTIGVAQGLSGLPLFSGLGYRFFCWIFLTSLLIVFVLFYANRIKKKPSLSPVYSIDSYWREHYEKRETVSLYQKSSVSTWVVYLLILLVLSLFSFFYAETHFVIGNREFVIPILPIVSVLYALLAYFSLKSSKQIFVLTLLLFTIVYLIIGVLAYGWYLEEIAALFLAMGILSGYSLGFDTDSIISYFISGAKDLLSAALIVGLAGGIIQILQDGKILDTLLYGLSEVLLDAGKLFSVGAMYVMQTLLNILIPSGSAKAALTMPILAPFSDVIGISRQITVLAFQFGDGFTNMITPTSGVLMGVLGVARIPYEIWVKWFYKILLVFIIVGFLLLIPTVYISFEGY